MAKSTMNVSVKIVPSEGKSQTKKVEVAKTGASLREICAQAGIDTKKKDFKVNGKPATLDTHVTREDVVEAKDTATVTVAERPQGS